MSIRVSFTLKGGRELAQLVRVRLGEPGDRDMKSGHCNSI